MYRVNEDVDSVTTRHPKQSKSKQTTTVHTTAQINPAPFRHSKHANRHNHRNITLQANGILSIHCSPDHFIHLYSILKFFGLSEEEGVDYSSRGFTCSIP